MCFLLLLVSPLSLATTPRDVYGQVELLITDINELRSKNNITEEARKPGIQIAKTPLHVYTKGLELLEKVNRYRSMQGLPASQEYSLPSKKVTPAEVLALVKVIRAQVAEAGLDHALNYTPDASIREGITPSDVYERIWYASYLMDGLAGSIKPSLVYRNAQKIEACLMDIAQKMGTELTPFNIDVPKDKKPIDVNIEAYKAFYKVVLLERNVGIPASRVPSFPAGNITPSDVYDTTNNIIAELARIGIALDVPPPDSVPAPSGQITPNHVYAQMVKVSDYLSQLQ